jgi:hypothetical protein
MAGETRELKVSLSFLLSEARKLSTDYFFGKAVPARPRLSYVIIRRRRKGHAHLAVYELIDNVINVLNFYHTARDWQAKLAEESGE